MSGPLSQTMRVGLRWRDMDMLGHVNQSVYHELLEEGRAALVTRIAAAADAVGIHGSFVLARVELDHRHEVRLDDGEVIVVVSVADVGRSSIRLEHEIRLTDGTVAASGTAVLVGWDPVARGKRELSPAERDFLRAAAL